MSERDKLLKTLFDTPGVEHVHILFVRGPRRDVTPEELCREANKAIEQARMAIGDPAP